MLSFSPPTQSNGTLAILLMMLAFIHRVPIGNTFCLLLIQLLGVRAGYPQGPTCPTDLLSYLWSLLCSLQFVQTHNLRVMSWVDYVDAAVKLSHLSGANLKE